MSVPLPFISQFIISFCTSKVTWHFLFMSILLLYSGHLPVCWFFCMSKLTLDMPLFGAVLGACLCHTQLDPEVLPPDERQKGMAKLRAETDKNYAHCMQKMKVIIYSWFISVIYNLFDHTCLCTSDIFVISSSICNTCFLSLHGTRHFLSILLPY